MGPPVAPRSRTEARLQPPGICTTSRLPVTASVLKQYKFSRDSVSSISHSRHIHTLEHTHKYKHAGLLSDTQGLHSHMHVYTYECQLLLLPCKTFTVINPTGKEIVHWFIMDDIIYPGEFCKMAISPLWKGWAQSLLRSQAALKRSAVPLWAAGSN